MLEVTFYQQFSCGCWWFNIVRNIFSQPTWHCYFHGRAVPSVSVQKYPILPTNITDTQHLNKDRKMVIWLVKQAHVQNPFPKSNYWIGLYSGYKNDLSIVIYCCTYSFIRRKWMNFSLTFLFSVVHEWQSLKIIWIQFIKSKKRYFLWQHFRS